MLRRSLVTLIVLLPSTAGRTTGLRWQFRSTAQSDLRQRAQLGEAAAEGDGIVRSLCRAPAPISAPQRPLRLAVRFRALPDPRTARTSQRMPCRTVVLASGIKRHLTTKDAVIEPIDPGWVSRFLAGITDPNVALIFLLVGERQACQVSSSPGRARLFRAGDARENQRRWRFALRKSVRLATSAQTAPRPP